MAALQRALAMRLAHSAAETARRHQRDRHRFRVNPSKAAGPERRKREAPRTTMP